MKSLAEKLSYEVTFASRMKGRRKVLDHMQQASPRLAGSDGMGLVLQTKILGRLS